MEQADHTGDKPNSIWAYTEAMRGWKPFPASIGILTTGLMESSHHIERVSRLSDVVLAAVVD